MSRGGNVMVATGKGLQHQILKGLCADVGNTTMKSNKRTTTPKNAKLGLLTRQQALKGMYDTPSLFEIENKLKECETLLAEFHDKLNPREVKQNERK